MNEHQKVVKWNADIPVGTPVKYLRDDGSTLSTATRSAAEVLGGHTAVVWLDDVIGCVALGRVSR